MASGFGMRLRPELLAAPSQSGQEIYRDKELRSLRESIGLFERFAGPSDIRLLGAILQQWDWRRPSGRADDVLPECALLEIGCIEEITI